MDTSKEYIEMCRKAEIQELWKPALADFTNFGAILALVKKIKNGSWELRCVYGAEIYSSSAIWLPRQDQLQDMVFEPNYNLYSLIKEFSRWVNEDAFFQNIVWFSQEQLWLAFVMYEKYGKKWNGEDWVKD